MNVRGTRCSMASYSNSMSVPIILHTLLLELSNAYASTIRLSQSQPGMFCLRDRRDLVRRGNSIVSIIID